MKVQYADENINRFISGLSDEIRNLFGGGNHRMRQAIADWIDGNVDASHEGIRKLHEAARASDIPWDTEYPLMFEEGQLCVRHARGSGAPASLQDWSRWLDWFIEEEMRSLAEWIAENEDEAAYSASGI